jgi:hypothetical protein
MAAAVRRDGLATGRAARDAGLADAAAHAPRFVDRALAALEAIARQQPTVHVDDVIAVGIEPPHPNAWGAVWMRAINAGLIARTGETRPSSDPRKRAHRYPVYRSLVFRADKAPNAYSETAA